MDRRTFVSAIALALLAALRTAEAQPAGRLPLVGILNAGSAHDRYVDEFLHGLRELGYTEGRNIAILHRAADGHQDRLPGPAADLVASRVDVLVAIGATVWAAKQATRFIPIIIAFSGDPVGVGIVSNLARPAGNITGVSFMSSDLAAKRLELLNQCSTSTTRIAVLHKPDAPSTVPELRETETAARTMGISSPCLPVSGPQPGRGGDKHASRALLHASRSDRQSGPSAPAAQPVRGTRGG